MYAINSDTESLVQIKELCLKREGTSTLHFQLHETISPNVDDKYVVLPAPLKDVRKPKEKYVVRGNNEVDAINEFIALTRGVKRIHYLFQDSNQTEGE